jgi:hypothetical protein
MAFKSEAQRRWASTPEGMQALGGKQKVQEWNEASKDLRLPERVKRSQNVSKVKQSTGFGSFGNFGKWK